MIQRLDRARQGFFTESERLRLERFSPGKLGPAEDSRGYASELQDYAPRGKTGRGREVEVHVGGISLQERRSRSLCLRG